jgi:hypothetical protein
MPLVVFEPTIPVFERAKTFHALDRTATVIGRNFLLIIKFMNCRFYYLYGCTMRHHFTAGFGHRRVLT